MRGVLRSSAIFFIDMSVLFLAYCLAYLFRFDVSLLKNINVNHAAHVFIFSFIAYASIFIISKTHRMIWRYVSLNEVISLVKQVFSGVVVAATATFLLVGWHYVPLSILPLQAVFYLSLLIACRGLYRLYRSQTVQPPSVKTVLIVGAGKAGESVLRDMVRNSEEGYRVVGMLDDDRSLQGRYIHGVKVRGRCNQLESMLKKYQPSMVVFAIPSLSKNHLLSSVCSKCQQYQVPVRVLPGLHHLTQGRISVDALRPVAIEDLLGREPVSLLNKALMHKVQNKVVLVTGGGGSIGSELCRQIALNKPRQLLIADNNEFNLYNIERELQRQFPTLVFDALLIDISNRQEVQHCFQQLKPQIIFHAAAFKHVPMLEHQPFSAVKINVLATKQLADIAAEAAVEDFILVSTDKAVNPTNVMGMTKRIAEIYCQNKNAQVATRYMTVRFGNVLGSAGSVLPLFKEQLQEGGPLTVTDPKMTRYFMTIPEAVNLILQSYLIGDGGEIFVLDMGDPVKIVDLAEKLIALSGKQPYKEVDIVFTGLRPGEKLFEELFYGAEQHRKTQQQKVFELQSRTYDWPATQDLLDRIERAYFGKQQEELLGAMCQLVPEYQGPHYVASGNYDAAPVTI